MTATSDAPDLLTAVEHRMRTEMGAAIDVCLGRLDAVRPHLADRPEAAG